MPKNIAGERALKKVLRDAETLRADTAVSLCGGLDVLPDAMWVVPDNARALEKAIREAKHETEELLAAAQQLRQAMRDFESSASPGTASVFAPARAVTAGGIPILQVPPLSAKTGRSARAAELLANLGGGPGTELLTADGKPVDPEDPLATGMRVVRPRYEAVVVVPGDVLGTGRLSPDQAERALAASNGSRPLFEAYLYAADPSGQATREAGARIEALAREYEQLHRPQRSRPVVWQIPENPDLAGAAAEALRIAGVPDGYVPLACIGLLSGESGANYRILCTTSNGGRKVYAVCSIYENEPGSARVTSRAVSDCGAPDFSGQPGGWSAPATPAVPQLVRDTLGAADEDARAAALLGTQNGQGNRWLMCIEREGAYYIETLRRAPDGSVCTERRCLLLPPPPPAPAGHVGGTIEGSQNMVIGGAAGGSDGYVKKS